MIYDEIYKKFYQVIVNYTFHKIKDEFYSQEIANETFKLLWQRWPTSDFKYENAVLKWLYETADYKIKEHRRKKYYDYISLESIRNQEIIDKTTTVDYEEIDNSREEQKYLDYISEVKKQLPSKDLAFFDMVVIQKLPYKQVAHELNTTVPAIKMRWLRLKIRLRKIVRDITGEEL